MTTKFYYMPTRVVIGENCILNNSQLFKTLGKKALIVTGAMSAKKNGSENDVKKALQSQGIEYVIFDKVKSNPDIPCIYEGAEVAKIENVDFIVAIGGGSPMDAGKGIALLAAQDISEDELFSGKYTSAVLPMAFVPTTAGTGSEVTKYSILTNDKAKTKSSIASEVIFPTVAFLDAKYTNSLSLTTTINTAVDALSHAVEGMLSVKSSVVSDALATASIQMIMNCIPDFLEGVKTGSIEAIDKDARENLLQASMLGGMVIAQTGTTAVHAMGYSLTYFKHIDHGRANGLVLTEYLELVGKNKPELVNGIINIMGFKTLKELKEMLENLLGEKEKISHDEIQKFSNLAIQTGNIGNCIVKPTEEDLIDMYGMSFK